MQPVMTVDTQPRRARVEESRIREAYSRRRGLSSRYSLFEAAQLFSVQERERSVLKILDRNRLSQLDGTRILEVGCGSGHWLREFVRWGARPEHVVGLDLLPERVAEARRLCPPQVAIECGRAVELPFSDGMFDVVLQSTMFSSILDFETRQKAADEMVRVVKRGGIILWYDFHANNPWNADVRGVKKQEIRTLFPGCEIELRRVTLAPPLARVIVRWSWLAGYLLAQIPLLRTHYLGVIRRT